MTNNQIIKILFRLGWKLYPTLEEALEKTGDFKLFFLKKAYAIFHGITTDNVDIHLTIPRMCGLPDVMPFSGSLLKWPTNNITWSVINTIGRLSIQSITDCASQAFSRWATVSGVNPIYKSNDRTAMIVINSRNIDGPYNVLGESELPSGQAQCHQWFDNGEPWIVSDNPSQNQIDLIRVMCHEQGHALGMNHIGTGNLLAPIYSINIRGPQQGDIQEMQSRYGPPAPPPVPVPPVPPVPPAPPPGSPNEIIIHINGSDITIPGYRVTKLSSATITSPSSTTTRSEEPEPTKPTIESKLPEVTK